MCACKYMSGWRVDCIPAYTYLHITLGSQAWFYIYTYIVKMMKDQSSCTVDVQGPPQNYKVLSV